MAAESPTILIVGAGAIGAFFGSALARQGGQVSVVCRSDYEAVRRDGYRIRSPLLGDHEFRPHQVLREVAECKVPPDYLILTVKVLPGVDRVALIRPAVGPRTVILLIENGIDIEAEIADAFPGNELLSSLAFVAIGRSGHGDIHHQAAGSLILGRYPQGPSPAAQRIAAMFEASRIGCSVTQDVIAARWQKAVWNTVFNPISILGGVLDTAMMLRTPEDQAFIRQCMEEVCAIAATTGHPMHAKLVEQMIMGTRSIPGYKTSMAQDYENGRPMEIEAILGNAVRTGRKFGVPIPALEAVYALAKMVRGAQE